MLYFNFHVHINSLIALPITALFIGYLFIAVDKKRFLYPTIAIVSAVLLIPIFYNPETMYFHRFISFFSRNNQVYLLHIFDYPFTWRLTLAFNIIGLIFVFKAKQIKTIYLHSVLFLGLIFFIYIANRYPSYVYSSHLVMLSIIGAVGGAWKMWQVIESRIIKVVLLFLFFGNSLLQVSNVNLNAYDNQGSAQHSIAYQTIVKNYDFKQDLLLMQYGRDFYLRELDQVEIFDMGSNGSLTLEAMLDYIKNKQTIGSEIWVVFETGKRGHLREEVLSYIEENFNKIHGQGIDETEIEVFYNKFY